MKSMTTQFLLIVVAVVFLMKGGLVLLASAWKLVAAVSLLGGGYYFVKKALAAGSGLSEGKASPQMKTASAQKGNAKSAVIEICPYCHSEVGSCEKCR